MEKKVKIAILSHWHTGSSLLAKQFRACGMEVGNQDTLWIPETCDAQCEHSYLNQMGNEFLLKRISPGALEVLIERVLKSYLFEAKENGWEHFGIKVTHALHRECWPIFKEVFDSVWKDVTYISSVRHIFGVFKSTRNDSAWSKPRILASVESCEEGLSYIANKGHIFYYPNDWFNGKIGKKIASIGLNWNEDAEKLFDVNRQYTFTEKGLMSDSFFLKRWNASYIGGDYE
jgi:hypothetical protein